MSRKLGRVWGALAGAMCAPALVFAQEVLEKCPRDHLREVYLQAIDRREVVDLAAVEVEVLKLCRERQGLISAILRGEEELADLAAKSETDAKQGLTASDAGSGILPALLPAARRGTRSGEAGESLSSPSSASPHDRGGRGTPAYRWFTVYGSGNTLVAGVTDGVKRWWVRAGDRLPGEVEVVSVGVRPASVRAAAGGRQWQLSGPASAVPASAAGVEGSP